VELDKKVAHLLRSGYFGVSDKDETHLLKEINIEFWSGDEKENIKTNVNYFVSNTHQHIHLTGNLLPTYMKYGAQPGDIVIFWKSKENENAFKAELVKPGSERWDMIDVEGDFPKYGGFLKLSPPGL
jgi:hypothetical protein